MNFVEKKISDIYFKEDYILRSKAYYLFICSFIFLFLALIMVIHGLISKPVYDRPGYLIGAILCTVVLLLILYHQFNKSVFFIAIAYFFVMGVSIVWGSSDGDQISILPAFLLFFLFYTNKKFTLLCFIYNLFLIVVFYYMHYEQRNLKINFLLDHLVSTFLISYLSYFLVKILIKHLEEKNVLIKELHHRVKNNLQVISGLLSLQTLRIKDKNSKQILFDFQNRIFSIASVHENLYLSKNYLEINFKRVIQKIINNLKIISKKVKILINIEEIKLGLDLAIPLALIINELLLNSFKHAFLKNAQSKEEIIMSLKKLNQENCQLIVSDNGKGIPKNINYQEPRTLGFLLVTNLVKQIHGNIEIISKKGTNIIITFSNQ